MKKYKVIHSFLEKNHDNHIYEVGEDYPAEGKKFEKARADFLTKKHEHYGVAFLEAVEEKKETTSKQQKPSPKDKEKSEV